MTTQAPAAAPLQAVRQISVRIQVGTRLMAASDDPLFLRLTGRCGREFRLLQDSGKSLRRGREDTFVLGPPDAKETSVSYPELNDPTNPQLDLSGIERVTLVKGAEPLPNVRGVGEMDDRLLIEEVEVLIEAVGGEKSANGGSGSVARFRRKGPHWLGLVCGLTLEIPPAENSET